MNYINELLFGKKISKEKLRNINLTNSSIKRLARKAGIMYLPKETYSTIKDIYFNKINDTLKKVEKITKQRNGKIIKSKDLEFLILKEKYENLYDQMAGNYDGWCDSQPTKCTDSLSLCGGNYDGWCDSQPTQCTDSLTLCGGNYDGWCDSQQSQCIDSLRLCGGNYDGWCDSQPSQCIDSLRLCGGNYDGWCDSQPSQCTDSLTLCGGNNIRQKMENFLFPHKTFNRYLRTKKNTDLKISSNLAINLHTYIENYVNDKLIGAKNLSNKSKDLNKSLFQIN